jgi:hypothetical protein
MDLSPVILNQLTGIQKNELASLLTKVGSISDLSSEQKSILEALKAQKSNDDLSSEIAGLNRNILQKPNSAINRVMRFTVNSSTSIEIPAVNPAKTVINLTTSIASGGQGFIRVYLQDSTTVVCSLYALRGQASFEVIEYA